jgi:hypothetical protein
MLERREAKAFVLAGFSPGDDVSSDLFREKQ